MITFIIGVLLLVLALFGTPLFTNIAAVALIAFHFAEIDSSAVIIELYRLASQPILLAIPLFTFAVCIRSIFFKLFKLLSSPPIKEIPPMLLISSLLCCIFTFIITCWVRFYICFVESINIILPAGYVCFKFKFFPISHGTTYFLKFMKEGYESKNPRSQNVALL